MFVSVTKSTQGMNCIEVNSENTSLHSFIRKMVKANHFDDPAYHLRSKCGAFLQGQDSTWTLVEFWSNDMEAINAFVSYINNNFKG